MSGVKQIAKIRTDIPEVDRFIAHVADTMNPVLRGIQPAGNFRLVEVPGLNGAAPTFALQYRNAAVGWSTVASFDGTGALAQQPWQAPTLLNSWVNNGGGYLPAGYYKDSIGVVHLRGTISNAPGTAANANILILPVGYRPSASVCGSGADVTVLASTYRRLNVDSAGQVFPVAAVAAGSVFCLDGITFDTRS